MKLFPAIDLYGGRAVRLLRGDFAAMTDYGDPLTIAANLRSAGAEQLHLVDLEGARTGQTPHLALLEKIITQTGLFCEVGGGIRSMETIRRYMEIGVGRLLLGTAAVEDTSLLSRALDTYGQRIAVSMDIRGDFVAVKGWQETTAVDCDSFCRRLESMGVKTVLCTDIGRDGAMQGTNLPLYRRLRTRYALQFIASGGVSTLEDIRQLAAMDIYGAVVGKALYSGALDIREALEAAKC